MNKKFINGMLVATLLAGAAGSFTSCSDYDDDIDNLQGQINGITAQVSDLQTKIQSGKTISNVVKTDDGLAITIDGTTYNITNGEKGADAAVWSIGEDGFWYKDGVKTDYKAIGVDGKDGNDGAAGADGNDGNDGNDGANGIYYVPNIETGKFDIYRDGEKIEESNIEWNTAAGSGMTAVFDGIKLILSGVEGSEAALELYPGVPVGSLAFVPSKMSNGLMQINDPFYLIAGYLSDKNADGSAITAGSPLATINELNASNEVKLVYRVNPNNATVAVTGAQFINRVISRAEGDATSLLNVVGTPVYEKGELTVTASANYKAFTYDKDNNPIAAQAGQSNVVAFQLWNGQAVTTSDYVEVQNMTGLTPVLGNIHEQTVAENVKGITNTGIYEWNNVLGTDSENAAGMTTIAANLTNAAAGVAYNDAKGLDLTTVVALANGVNSADYKTLKDLGFDGITYTFTLPKEYNVDATNQQAFVTLNGSTLTVVQSGQLAGTQAIGRTPIVRVDGMVDGKLVNRSYIKIEIVAKTVNVDGTSTAISAAKNFNYTEIGTAWDSKDNKHLATSVAEMSWQAVNEILYGKTGLTSTSFWDNFAPAAVTIKTTEVKNGKDEEVTIAVTEDVANKGTFTGGGIKVVTATNNAPTNTAAISISIDNSVKTQNTYKDMGNGAQYNVAITYASKNKALYGDVVLTQVINVKDNFNGFDLSAGYAVPNVQNLVVCKGELKNKVYDMTLKLDDVFATIEENGVKKPATSYMESCYNVTSVEFKNITPEVENADGSKTQLFALDGAAATTEATLATTTTLAPAEEMTAPTMTANLQYTATLVNGEVSKNVIKLDAQFNNPFVAATITKLTFNGNSKPAVSLDAWKKVNVLAASDKKTQIFGLAGNTFGFTAAAVDFGYEKTATTTTPANWTGADPTIAYSFVKNDGYNSFIKDVTGSTLKIDETTGVITYTSATPELHKKYNLTVQAVVTFEDLSKVTVNIPVEVTTE